MNFLLFKPMELVPKDYAKESTKEIIISGEQEYLENLVADLDNRGFEFNAISHINLCEKDGTFVNTYKYLVVNPSGSYSKINAVASIAMEGEIKLTGYVYPIESSIIYETINKVDRTNPEVILDLEDFKAITTAIGICTYWISAFNMDRVLLGKSGLTEVAATLYGVNQELCDKTKANLGRILGVEFCISERLLVQIEKLTPLYQSLILNGNCIGKTQEVQDRIEWLKKSFEPITDASGNQIITVYYKQLGMPATFYFEQRCYRFGSIQKSAQEIETDIRKGDAYISTVVTATSDIWSVNSPVRIFNSYQGTVDKILYEHETISAVVINKETGNSVTLDATLLAGEECTHYDYLGNHLLYGENVYTVNHWDQLEVQPNAGFNGDGGLQGYLANEDARWFNPLVREVRLFKDKKDAQAYIDSRYPLLSVEDVEGELILPKGAKKALLKLARLRYNNVKAQKESPDYNGGLD